MMSSTKALKKTHSLDDTEYCERSAVTVKSVALFGLRGIEEDIQDVQNWPPPVYIAIKHASLSVLLTTILSHSEDLKEGIPLFLVAPTQLKQVVRYLTHHAGKKPPDFPEKLLSCDVIDACSDSWDAAFIEDVYSGERKLEALYDLTNVASYMDIESLLTLCLVRIACICKAQNMDVDKLKLALTP
jgi:hypothetical protein